MGEIESTMQKRIEALEEQVASLYSALVMAEDVMGWRLYLLEERQKADNDQQSATA